MERTKQTPTPRFDVEFWPYPGAKRWQKRNKNVYCEGLTEAQAMDIAEQCRDYRMPHFVYARHRRSHNCAQWETKKVGYVIVN